MSLIKTYNLKKTPSAWRLDRKPFICPTSFADFFPKTEDWTAVRIDVYSNYQFGATQICLCSHGIIIEGVSFLRLFTKLDDECKKLTKDYRFVWIDVSRGI